MKKVVVLIAIILGIQTSCFQANAQVVIDQAAESMAVDPQGNVYLIADAKLSKYASDGRLLSTYTNNMLGHISSIDADNPLKIMLFYKDAGVILFLDDQFAQIGDQIDLFAQGFSTISLAAYSSKSEIILYDEVNSELIILDMHFNVKEKIHNNFEEFHPNRLFDVNEKMIVMQDAAQGVFFFDNFGTYEKNIMLLSENPIQIIENQIFYLAEKQLRSYDFQKLEGNILGNVPDGTKQALIYRDSYIFLDDKGAFIIHQ